MKAVSVLKEYLLISTLVAIIVILTGCKNKPEEDPVTNIVEHSSYSILTDTIYQTDVHLFKSNICGPKVFIIGGIHGNEIAGWMAATELINRDDYIGEVMIIPRANYLATQLEQRYPGVGNNGIYDGIKYSDLNRSFPGNVEGTITEQIAFVIIQQIIDFQPEYILDFHESKGSYSDPSPSLGNEVIYGNSKSALLALDLVDIYNQRFTEENETPVAVDSSPPDGSLNNYCGKHLDSYIFTFETNNKLNLVDRIDQHKNLLNVLFELIWN